MDQMQPGQGGDSRFTLARGVSLSLVILGAVAFVIGLVLVLVPSDQASVGWFAYAPLSETTFVPPGVLPSPRSQIGIVLSIVGSAVLAFDAGWMLGQRQAAGQRRLPDPGSPGS